MFRRLPCCLLVLGIAACGDSASTSTGGGSSGDVGAATPPLSSKRAVAATGAMAVRTGRVEAMPRRAATVNRVEAMPRRAATVGSTHPRMPVPMARQGRMAGRRRLRAVRASLPSLRFQWERALTPSRQDRTGPFGSPTKGRIRRGTSSGASRPRALSGTSPHRLRASECDGRLDDAAADDAREATTCSSAACSTAGDCATQLSGVAGCWTCSQNCCSPVAAGEDPESACSTACTMAACDGTGACSQSVTNRTARRAARRARCNSQAAKRNTASPPLPAPATSAANIRITRIFVRAIRTGFVAPARVHSTIAISVHRRVARRSAPRPPHRPPHVRERAHRAATNDRGLIVRPPPPRCPHRDKGASSAQGNGRATNPRGYQDGRGRSSNAEQPSRSSSAPGET